MNNRGTLAAIKLRSEIGISDPNEIPLEDVILGRGGYVQYKSMGSTDGRIVYGKSICTIYINSDIQYDGRRRFALAHEMGHLEMHRGSAIHDDNNSLDWFNNAERQLRNGVQEFEANQFASEYLMPMELFLNEASGIQLSPDLLKSLSERFETSITSVAFRYFESNLHPMAIFHIYNGIVKYWKKSNDLNVWIGDKTRLAPPSDSVAMEYINANYNPIYKSDEQQQEIYKSTWFEVRDDDAWIDCVFIFLLDESFNMRTPP